MEPQLSYCRESYNIPDRDGRIARYTSTNKLLTLYTEKSERRFKFAGRQTALDVCERTTDAIMNLEITPNNELELPVTGDRYLLTGCDCMDWTWPNDYKVREGWNRCFCTRF